MPFQMRVISLPDWEGAVAMTPRRKRALLKTVFTRLPLPSPRVVMHAPPVNNPSLCYVKELLFRDVCENTDRARVPIWEGVHAVESKPPALLTATVFIESRVAPLQRFLVAKWARVSTLERRELGRVEGKLPTAYELRNGRLRVGAQNHVGEFIVTRNFPQLIAVTPDGRRGLGRYPLQRDD